MISEKLVYIASPYSGGSLKKNIKRQIKAVHRVMDTGYVAYSPIIHNHYLHQYRNRDYEQWMEHCFIMLKKADVLLRLGGKSPGAEREIELAKENGLEIIYGWKNFRKFIFSEIDYNYGFRPTIDNESLEYMKDVHGFNGKDEIIKILRKTIESNNKK